MSNLFSPEILQQLEELNLKVVTAEEWDKLQKVLYKNDHADKDKEIILAGKFDFEPNLWDEYKLAGEIGEELSSIIRDYLINNNQDLAWLKNAKVEIRITPTK
jgi:hypothetical protein